MPRRAATKPPGTPWKWPSAHHPDYATAHENLGDIYAKMAAIEYGKVLALDSKNTTAQTRLKLIQTMLGGQATKRRPSPLRFHRSGQITHTPGPVP